MGNPLFREYEKLVEITIMGKKFQVPEKNTLLRVFQFISPETVPYGRFCWNQECQLCRAVYKMPNQPDSEARGVLTCKVLVAEGQDDCEGEILERVRAIVGTSCRVVTVLDMHGSLTPAMVKAADLLSRKRGGRITRRGLRPSNTKRAARCLTNTPSS